MRAAPWVLVGALASAGAGACGATNADGPPAVNADFRDIQAAEARLERSVAVAEDEALPCVGRREAAMVAARASVDVCAVARRTVDSDVNRRCAQARARAAQVRARVDAACACATESDAARCH